MFFPNLKAEMARKKMNAVSLAEVAGIGKTAIYAKIKGTSVFTLDEAYAIKEALEVDMPLEELFKKEEE